MRSLQDGISVVICSFNGRTRLADTLLHLARQEFEVQLNWEVILVDNNSSDNTAAFSSSFWATHGPGTVPLKVVREEKAGVAYARSKAVSQLQYRFTVFCDDDNWLAREYLSRVYLRLSENPRIGALGGYSEPVSEVVLPEWFSSYQVCYACGPQAADSGDVSERGFVWGAGMAVRSSLLAAFCALHTEPLLPGRQGNILSAGDDSELCRFILLQGYRLWYEEGLKFRHFLPEARLSARYRDEMIEGIARAEPVLGGWDLLIQDTHIASRWQVLLGRLYSYAFRLGLLRPTPHRVLYYLRFKSPESKFDFSPCTGRT